MDARIKGVARHLINRDRMIADIGDLAYITFRGEDPEMEWKFFREQLRLIKKEYVNSWLEYMESDDDTEYPETEWQKFKRETR